MSKPQGALVQARRATGLSPAFQKWLECRLRPGRGAVKLPVAVAEEHLVQKPGSRSLSGASGRLQWHHPAWRERLPLYASATCFFSTCMHSPGADKRQETVYRKRIARNCRYPKGHASPGCMINDVENWLMKPVLWNKQTLPFYRIPPFTTTAN
jgi:hypothetical protein